ncbi:MAG TPA: RDD family protein [Gemmatimonadaceae bacterium]
MANYYLIDGARSPIGPLSLSVVADMHRAGRLPNDAMLVTEGGASTQRVEDLLVSEQVIPPHLPPAPRPRCRACHNLIPARADWCPDCKASTRDFVDARLASPGRRLVAFLIDAMLPSGVGITFHTGPIVHHGVLPTAFSLAVAIWACLLYSRGMTPGKFLLGMEVLDENGDPASFWRMIVREWLAKPLSGLVFGLGYFWILISHERQGWHDSLCGTHVVVRGDRDPD